MKATQYKITNDGGFAAYDPETGWAGYAYPSSPITGDAKAGGKRAESAMAAMKTGLVHEMRLVQSLPRIRNHWKRIAELYFPEMIA